MRPGALAGRIRGSSPDAPPGVPGAEGANRCFRHRQCLRKRYFSAGLVAFLRHAEGSHQAGVRCFARGVRALPAVRVVILLSWPEQIFWFISCVPRRSATMASYGGPSNR
jgi:hypothetical protein